MRGAVVLIAALRELLGLRPGQAIPAWASDELVASESAVARLRAWIQSGGLALSPMTPARIDAEIAYLGDPEIGRVTVSTLALLPRCVVDRALTAEFYGVGRSTSGWVSTAPPRRPREADEEEITVVVLSGELGDEALARLIGHEVAHLWLEPRPTVADNRPPAARLEPLKSLGALAREWGQPESLSVLYERSARAEKLACELAARWGLGASGATAAACIRGAAARLNQVLREGAHA